MTGEIYSMRFFKTILIIGNKIMFIEMNENEFKVSKIIVTWQDKTLHCMYEDLNSYAIINVWLFFIVLFVNDVFINGNQPRLR